MPERAFLNRRQKRGNQDSAPLPWIGADKNDVVSRKTSISSIRNKSVTSTIARQNSKNIKSTRFRGLRPRASTLPSLISTSVVPEDASVTRDNYSDSFPLEDPSTISTRDDYDDEDDDDDDDDLDGLDGIADDYDDFNEQPFAEGVTYDVDIYGTDSDDDDENMEYQEPPDLRSQFFHHHPADGALELPENAVHPVDNHPLFSTVNGIAPIAEDNSGEENIRAASNMLSGLSEEDDSDMEEELEFAVLQMKLKPSTPTRDDDSMLSMSRPPSATPSPRTLKKHNNSNGSTKRYVPRQRSFDVSKTAGTNGLEKNPRHMSVPTKSQPQINNGLSNKTGHRRLTPELSASSAAARRRPTDPGLPIMGFPISSQVTPALPDSNLSSVTIEYPEASLAAQEKLEIGLGLRDPSSAIVASSFFTSTKKSRQERSESISSPVIKKLALPAAGTVQTRPSMLTSQIKVNQAGFDNPLEEYVSASGKSERKPLKLKMYMPCSDEPQKAWEVIVRTDVNVSNAIGFALYCFMKEKRTPALPDDLCNANKWTLRIVEDDGEPDEDFPALDRTRMISAYSFDEFALVEATAAQIVEHEKITPSTRKKAPKPPVEDTKLETATPADQAEEEPPEKVILRVYQYPFDEMVSALYWTGEVSIKTPLDEILYHICVDKDLDRNQYVCKIAGRRSIIPAGANALSLNGQYNLEITPRRIVNKMNGYDELLSDLQVIKKTRSANAIPSASNNIASTAPAVTAPSGLRSSLSLKRTSVSLTAPFGFRTSLDESSSGAAGAATHARISFGTTRPSATVGGPSMHGMPGINASTAAHNRAASNARASMMVPPLLPETLNGIGYQKYKIWRRQPMSFINRHERVLALDGEYVHIMPSDDRAWYDYSPKTSSFHISQMTKCKQSRKIPNNFKVVIMKTTGVSKRYDLEALTVSQAQEIVAKLKGLLSSYQMNKDSSRRH